MLKKSLIITLLICSAIIAHAQKSHRYKDLVFTNVTIAKNISYKQVAKDERKSYLFDLYQPLGDKVQKRPLIIWMHGGGFKFGSKEAKGVKIWSKTFAQRGYVCADINYRLSKKQPLLHFDILLQSSYYAVQDAKAAIKYFREHADQYGIDPDKIILAGNSAGGMIAMQAAFATNKEFADMAKIPTDSAAVNNPEGRAKVIAVINLWGAIYNLDWLKNSNTPIISILGSNDSLVPPRHKSAPLFGGEDIHDKADSLGIPNKLRVFEGYSHELQKHFNPFFEGGKGTQQRWLEAGQFAADFLYSSVLNK
jgi:poly(3-hydroxybutyrate) depolymerase